MKRKRQRAILNDLSKWRAEMMARCGGFSHRYITEFVLGTKNPSEHEVAAVARHLLREGLKVTDWRRGISVLAKAHAEKVTRPKRRGNKDRAA